MTLVLELPREIEERLDELAREKAVTREEIALHHLATLQTPKLAKPRELKSWGLLKGSGLSSDDIHRERREEVARELGEMD